MDYGVHSCSIFKKYFTAERAEIAEIICNFLFQRFGVNSAVNYYVSCLVRLVPFQAGGGVSDRTLPANAIIRIRTKSGHYEPGILLYPGDATLDIILCNLRQPDLFQQGIAFFS